MARHPALAVAADDARVTSQHIAAAAAVALAVAAASAATRCVEPVAAECILRRAACSNQSRTRAVGFLCARRLECQSVVVGVLC